MSTFEFDDSSLADLGQKAPSVDTMDVGPKPTPAAAAPAPAPADTRKQIYTVLARQGINAAEVVNAAMQKRTLGTTTPRRVEVIAPHGPSTSGGKKARQSITLAPAAGQGASIVFGFLDAGAKTFEVRPYPLVAQQYRQRFGESFDASADEYEALGKDLGRILSTLGFKLAEAKDEPEDERRAAKPVAGASDEDDELGDDEDDDEYEIDGILTRKQKLILLGVGVVTTIVLTLWWLK